MSIAMDIRMLFGNLAADDEQVEIKVLARDASEAELVARAQTGDEPAFEELVRRYRNDVYGLSYHFMRNREEAWDVSQEVFIKAYRSLKRFRGESGFKTWLLRITANHCKDHFKKRRVATVSMDALPTQDFFAGSGNPEQAMRNTELGQAIQQALDGLSPKHRLAFVLREFEDMSYKEMADVMQCSEGTVMSRLHHARKKLQNSLARLGFVEGG